MLKEISDMDFSKEVEEDRGVVFVDFWAPWCGPCLLMTPVLERMAQKYPNIKFCKVNTTQNMEKAGKLGISGIPCVIVFREGKEIERLIGFRPGPVFEGSVKKYVD
jgi:thioredoxin 1